MSIVYRDVNDIAYTRKQFDGQIRDALIKRLSRYRVPTRQIAKKAVPIVGCAILDQAETKAIKLPPEIIVDRFSHDDVVDLIRIMREV
jgi:hypothetical protein